MSDPAGPMGKLERMFRGSGKPDRPTRPAQMDTLKTGEELERFLHRGGKIADDTPKGRAFMRKEYGSDEGGVKLPGGIYGGEWDDKEWAAYRDASGKLGRESEMQSRAPAREAARRMTEQRPDATRRDPDEHAATLIHHLVGLKR